MQRLQSPTQRSLSLPSAHIRSPSSLSQHLSVSNRLSRSAPSRTLGIVNAASTAQKTERVQLGNSGKLISPDSAVCAQISSSECFGLSKLFKVLSYNVQIFQHFIEWTCLGQCHPLKLSNSKNLCRAILLLDSRDPGPGLKYCQNSLLPPKNLLWRIPSWKPGTSRTCFLNTTGKRYLCRRRGGHNSNWSLVMEWQVVDPFSINKTHLVGEKHFGCCLECSELSFSSKKSCVQEGIASNLRMNEWMCRSGYWGQNSFGNYTDNDLRQVTSGQWIQLKNPTDAKLVAWGSRSPI